MFNRKNLIAMTVMIIGLFMFVPIAQAERQEFEGIACYSNTHTPIQASPGDILLGALKGKVFLGALASLTSRVPFIMLES